MFGERGLRFALATLAAIAASPPAGAEDRCVQGNCQNGFGTAEISDERVHRGLWQMGIRHGFGRETTTAGDQIWEGSFANGSLNGEAFFTAVREGLAGDYYHGGWQGGRRHGYGVYMAADGSRYCGDFRDGAREGKGEWATTTGVRYVGDFARDRFHGTGSIVMPTWLEYTGEWQDGRRHGSGDETFFDGVFRYRGSYREDRPDGSGTVWMEGREIHRGGVSPERGYGFGTIRRDDGTLYVGELRDGRPEGRGAERTVDGDVRVGVWAGGARRDAP